MTPAGVRAAVAAWIVSLSASAQSPALPPLPARGTVQVAFPPWENAERLVLDAVGSARRQILVQAYGFTSRAIAEALIAAHRRGVEVLVTADREQTYSAGGSRIPALAAAGIPVRLEVRYQSAHNKVMVIDAASPEATVVTGSYNWTWSAQWRNSENVLVFRNNPELAQRYAANWRRHADEALPWDQVQR